MGNIRNRVLLGYVANMFQTLVRQCTLWKSKSAKLSRWGLGWGLNHIYPLAYYQALYNEQLVNSVYVFDRPLEIVVYYSKRYGMWV